MLIRMIASISRWDGTLKVNRDDGYIPGDTVSDLRTAENTISVWKGDTQQDIDDALLALALNRNDVRKICYVFLEENELKRLGIELEEKEGKAPGITDKAILNKHRNLVDIDLWRMGYLAEYILEKGKDPNQLHTFSDKKVKNLLNGYKSKLDMSKVNERLKEKLNW